MASSWKRTGAVASIYGYTALTQERNGRWCWYVFKGAKRLFSGSTERESSARTAARRWIIRQPGVHELHAEATRLHWTGEPFGGDPHASWRNSDREGTRFVGACGSKTGASTDYPGERERIGCDKCLALIAESERIGCAP